MNILHALHDEKRIIYRYLFDDCLKHLIQITEDIVLKLGHPVHVGDVGGLTHGLRVYYPEDIRNYYNSYTYTSFVKNYKITRFDCRCWTIKNHHKYAHRYRNHHKPRCVK